MVRAHEWDASRLLHRSPGERQPWWAASPLAVEPVLRLELEIAGECAVLSVTGDLDAFSAPDLESYLEGRCLAGCSVLEVDLTGVPTLASAGLSALISVRRECERRGMDLRLRGARRSVLRVFELTGLARIFTFADPPAEPAADPDPALF
jgi:anti-anti-sigma factor